MFPAEQTEAAVDLLELMELGWHDCYGASTPPEDLVDNMLLLSDGTITGLIAGHRPGGWEHSGGERSTPDPNRNFCKGGAVRRDGWLLAVPLTPLVMIGAFMTVLVFPAIIGIPLLLVTARPWWSALSVGLNRRVATDLSTTEQVWIGVCVVTGVVTFVVCALLGLNDLDTLADGLGWLVFAAMVVGATGGAVGLVKSASAGADDRRSA